MSEAVVTGWDKSSGSVAVRALFGSANNENAGDMEEPDHAGRLFIDDVHFETGVVTTQKHNVIDRFTGGVRDGLLFEEELLFRTPFVGENAIHLYVDQPESVPLIARQALHKALEDLARGRLALGAGSGRGHGFFRGRIAWSDNGRWIGGKA
jgi:hypothetical protein